MRVDWKKSCLLLACLFLAACGAPPGLVKPDKPIKVTRIFKVTPDREWAHSRFLNGDTWTIDGIALNRIIFYTNIRDKYHVFANYRATKRRPDGAFYRKGMDAGELEAVFRDAFTGVGLANVKTSNLRPISLKGYPAFRFEVEFDLGNGLHYRGSTVFLERREKLNFIWFSAPDEHYYPRDAEGFERILESIEVRP